MYEKPMLLASDDLAEGVYLASGSSSDGDCWQPTYKMVQQRPELGHEVTVFQLNGHHFYYKSDHTGRHPHMIIYFNQPVNITEHPGTIVGGATKGVTQIDIVFEYIQSNQDEDDGFGNLAVSSESDVPVDIVNITMHD